MAERSEDDIISEAFTEGFKAGFEFAKDLGPDAEFVTIEKLELEEGYKPKMNFKPALPAPGVGDA